MPKPHVHLEATAPTVNGVRSSLVKRLRTPHDDLLPPRSASSLEFVDLLLPLAAYIRGNLSRSAIYVGGGTQLMFGIWGSRWVGRPDVKAIANEFWVHPSKSEVPSNAKKLEGAAYF